jgi:hypothetical protein
MTRWRDQDGTLAVEAAIVAPVLLVLMLLVVYAGRAAQTDADVRSAAARAARAASLTGDVTCGRDRSHRDRRRQPRNRRDRLPHHRHRRRRRHPGRRDRHRQVGCEVSNTDLAMLAVPGTRWSTATATQVVDTYRGGG